MSLYELKMHLKQFYPVKKLLSIRNKIETKKKNEAMKTEGLDVIREVNAVLTECDYTIFVDFGTLIGAAREHNLLAWDFDIDYGIVVDEKFTWTDFENYMLKHNAKKVREFKYGNKITEQTYQYKNLTVDFFAHKNGDNDGQVYFYYRKDGYIYHSSSEYHAVLVKTPRIDEVTKGNIGDIIVNIPYNYDEYLESIYTKNWKVPDPDWNDQKVVMSNRFEFPEAGRVIYYK